MKEERAENRFNEQHVRRKEEKVNRGRKQIIKSALQRED